MNIEQILRKAFALEEKAEMREGLEFVYENYKWVLGKNILTILRNSNTDNRFRENTDMEISELYGIEIGCIDYENPNAIRLFKEVKL